MKNSAEYGSKLKTLLARLKKEYKVSVPTDPMDPIEALLFACLSEETTDSKARTLLKRLKSFFVDFNEIRVCRTEELAEVLGKGFPESRKCARVIISLLQNIFDELDTLSLKSLCESGKRESKNFLSKLESINPYILSRIMLESIGGHAFPVHAKMLEVLRGEEVVNPKADISDIQGFLERQITSDHIHEYYALLRHHCDHYKHKTRDAKEAKTTKKTKKKVAAAKSKKTEDKTAKKKAKTTKKSTKTTKKKNA